jgi:3-isopropylmalate dehydrogenase
MSSTYNIAVLPGDGTGPEVVAEGIKVLQTAADKAGFKINLTTFDFGGERYLKTGETLPEGAVDELKKFDAIFLGAIGHPDVKPGILEKEVLLKLRFELDQYINFRPVKLYPGIECPIKDKGPEDIDFLVIRENTEGVYAGSGGFLKKGTPDEIAVQDSINTRKGVERCIRFAFEACRKRNSNGAWKGLTEEEKAAGKIGKLTLCGKTNVLTFAFDLWERAFREVAEEYQDIVADYAHVDAITMWFVKNPEWFDVIVTDNMFGDIITDLGAMIQGGMGIAAGGNLNPEGVSMFEPIGGSAPKYKGMNKINPLAAICAAGVMLEYLGEEESGKKIESAVMKVTADHLKSLAAGHMGMTTTEVGDLVAKYVNES